MPVTSNTCAVLPHWEGLLGSRTTSYLPKEETSLTDFDPPGHVLLSAETVNKLRWTQSWMRKADRQGGGPSSAPVPVHSGNVWTMMGLLQPSAGQSRCRHLPLAIRWREEKCCRQHFSVSCRKTFPAFFIYLVQTHFVLSVLQVPPCMHVCSDYPSTTLLPFILHPALQSPPPHPASCLIQALSLALHWHWTPWYCENLSAETWSLPHPCHPPAPLSHTEITSSH